MNERRLVTSQLTLKMYKNNNNNNNTENVCESRILMEIFASGRSGPPGSYLLVRGPIMQYVWLHKG